MAFIYIFLLKSTASIVIGKTVPNAARHADLALKLVPNSSTGQRCRAKSMVEHAIIYWKEMYHAREMLTVQVIITNWKQDMFHVNFFIA